MQRHSDSLNYQVYQKGQVGVLQQMQQRLSPMNEKSHQRDNLHNNSNKNLYNLGKNSEFLGSNTEKNEVELYRVKHNYHNKSSKSRQDNAKQFSIYFRQNDDTNNNENNFLKKRLKIITNNESLNSMSPMNQRRVNGGSEVQFFYKKSSSVNQSRNIYSSNTTKNSGNNNNNYTHMYPEQHQQKFDFLQKKIENQENELQKKNRKGESFQKLYFQKLQEGLNRVNIIEDQRGKHKSMGKNHSIQGHNIPFNNINQPNQQQYSISQPQQQQQQQKQNQPQGYSHYYKIVQNSVNSQYNSNNNTHNSKNLQPLAYTRLKPVPLSEILKEKNNSKQSSEYNNKNNDKFIQSDKKLNSDRKLRSLTPARKIPVEKDININTNSQQQIENKKQQAKENKKIKQQEQIFQTIQEDKLQNTQLQRKKLSTMPDISDIEEMKLQKQALLQKQQNVQSSQQNRKDKQQRQQKLVLQREDVKQYKYQEQNNQKQEIIQKENQEQNDIFAKEKNRKLDIQICNSAYKKRQRQKQKNRDFSPIKVYGNIIGEKQKENSQLGQFQDVKNSFNWRQMENLKSNASVSGDFDNYDIGAYCDKIRQQE